MSLRNQLPADIKMQVRTWLEGFEGYKLQEDPGASVEWGYKLVSATGEPTNIYQLLNRVDHIVVSEKYELVATLKNLLDQLSENGKAQLYFELRTTMFRSECYIEVRFSDQRTPLGFKVNMPIFADALTQDTLFYRTQKVHNASQLLLAFLNRAAFNYPKRQTDVQK